MARNPAKPKKVTHHISLEGPLSDAVRALATLEGREINDYFREGLRNILKERGLDPIAKPDAISAEIERIKTSGTSK
jgi:hypothetical protein